MLKIATKWFWAIFWGRKFHNRHNGHLLAGNSAHLPPKFNGKQFLAPFQTVLCPRNWNFLAFFSLPFHDFPFPLFFSHLVSLKYYFSSYNFFCLCVKLKCGHDAQWKKGDNAGHILIWIALGKHKKERGEKAIRGPGVILNFCLICCPIVVRTVAQRMPPLFSCCIVTVFKLKNKSPSFFFHFSE